MFVSGLHFEGEASYLKENEASLLLDFVSAQQED